jgi:hypothetical protein
MEKQGPFSSLRANASFPRHVPRKFLCFYFYSTGHVAWVHPGMRYYLVAKVQILNVGGGD